MTSLTSRLVAAALLAGALAACSGDDTASLPSTTRVTEDPKVVARERMCEALQLYVSAEQRRPSGPVADPSIPQRLEDARKQALANLTASLTADVPASVKDALTQLAGIPIESPADTTTTAEAAPTTTVSPAQAPLKVVTDALDPVCGTEGGLTPTTTTTTASTTTGPTTGAGGAGASTTANPTSTAPTTATTAAR